MTAVWSGAELAERSERLGTFLREQQALWRPLAFRQPLLPWEDELPELGRALRALPAAQAARLAEDETALADWLAPWLPFAPKLAALCRVPAHTRRVEPTLPEPRDVPGRKQAQIAAFTASLARTDLPALEWCAGKAHLGRRYAAADRQPVLALERDPALVAAGQALAVREGLPVTLQEQDVLQPAAAALLGGEQQVLALHACGELHRQLLRSCVERRPRAVALAPCCYHLHPRPDCPPLSRTAARTALVLGRDELRTAVRDSVTSSPRVQRQRRQLQAWRLGFDLLQRELRGVDDYLPTPPLPLSVLAEGFAACCARFAEHHGLALPAVVDFPRFAAAGARRMDEVTALDLPRMLFRRPLELWLALDRALFLQEHGYAVELGCFCPRALTPRNLLIRASRAD